MRITKELRINDRIRIPRVMLIDENGVQIGAVDVQEAIARAKAAGLDLVEVAPAARPPVCRVMDYGKYKYRQKKKEHQHKTTSHLKEVRLTPKIQLHDLTIKAEHAKAFLVKGNKVLVSLVFKGRELDHTDLGLGLLDRFVQSLDGSCRVEAPAKREGKRFMLMLVPK